EELVALSWQGAGSRVVKYVQTFAQRRGLAPDERALVTVLLLRGPQPAGALKTRAERLHRFADRAEVEACLARMAGARPRWCASCPAHPVSRTLAGSTCSARSRWPGPVQDRYASTVSRCSRPGPRHETARFARRTPRLPRPMRSNYPMSSPACRSKGGCCAESSTWPAVRQ